MSYNNYGKMRLQKGSGTVMKIDNACDYIIQRVIASGEMLSNLKLQKLLYYVQAWNLVFENKPLFDGKFQAWVHGPVSRNIYARYATTKTLYSDITVSDVSQDFDPKSLDVNETSHIDRVLSVYAKFSGAQLEEMTHREDPWVQARDGYEPFERCEKDIDEEIMKRYYAQRLI